MSLSIIEINRQSLTEPIGRSLVFSTLKSQYSQQSDRLQMLWVESQNLMIATTCHLPLTFSMQWHGLLKYSSQSGINWLWSSWPFGNLISLLSAALLSRHVRLIKLVGLLFRLWRGFSDWIIRWCSSVSRSQWSLQPQDRDGQRLKSLQTLCYSLPLCSPPLAAVVVADKEYVFTVHQ